MRPRGFASGMRNVRGGVKVKKLVDNVLLEVVAGDITGQQGIGAVVNAANAELRKGGGVAGAIHRVAGPELERACRPLAPIKPGNAVITPAFNLPNQYVIHCLGPVYGVDQPAAQLLADCYRNALTLADEHRVDSTAFPAISTGAFGYPMRPAARVAFKTVRDCLQRLRYVKRIRFVLYGRQALEVHERVFVEVFGPVDQPGS